MNRESFRQHVLGVQTTHFVYIITLTVWTSHVMCHKVVSGLGFESFVVTPLAAGACHDVEL